VECAESRGSGAEDVFQAPAPGELLGVNDALDRLVFVECAHACAGNAAVAPDLQLGLTSRVLIAQREFLH
jgi:hypothetical protein